jgi:plasminogen activator inhibitor 1 RNA-binding protein
LNAQDGAGTDGEQKEKDQDSDSAPQVDTDGAPGAEEEVKEMTLDEWKAQQRAARSKPQYNLRKAGEGEDTQQWKAMVALNKKRVSF